MNAEQFIKSKLDGTFTRINRLDGRVYTTEVPRDYIPSHEPPDTNTGPAAPKRGGRISRWTDAQNDELVRLRREGKTKWACAQALGVSEKSIRDRIKRLRNRGVEVPA